MAEKTRALIDPDGTGDPGLGVLVLASTNVVYRMQAGGHYTMPLEAEGFLVPIGPPLASNRLREFFAKHSRIGHHRPKR
jgi:uncharacterized protein DUF6210